MASAAPITGAPTSAPPVADTLSRFEDAYGIFDCLTAVLQAASDEIGASELSTRNASRLLCAGLYIAEHLATDMKSSIDAGFAERRA